tara:strand:+ start:272 stop:385 length:114 start_codon:yes stop_codon:yes gene_type:complete
LAVFRRFWLETVAMAGNYRERLETNFRPHFEKLGEKT